MGAFEVQHMATGWVLNGHVYIGRVIGSELSCEEPTHSYSERTLALYILRCVITLIVI